MRTFVWLVPLAAGLVLAHGCLNPQPTVPARDESSGSDGATTTSSSAEGASATTSPGGTATGGGIEDGTGGTGSGEPGQGAAGAGGAAGATGLDQGGAPPDQD